MCTVNQKTGMVEGKSVLAKVNSICKTCRKKLSKKPWRWAGLEQGQGEVGRSQMGVGLYIVFRNLNFILRAMVSQIMAHPLHTNISYIENRFYFVLSSKKTQKNKKGNFTLFTSSRTWKSPDPGFAYQLLLGNCHPSKSRESLCFQVAKKKIRTSFGRLGPGRNQIRVGFPGEGRGFRKWPSIRDKRSSQMGEWLWWYWGKLIVRYHVLNSSVKTWKPHPSGQPPHPNAPQVHGREHGT